VAQTPHLAANVFHKMDEAKKQKENSADIGNGRSLQKFRNYCGIYV
jgi:hypothetical protein